MPRAARKVSSTKVYHVILRGNDKQDLFFEEEDYKKFIKEIKNTKEKYGYELYAYCLMTNHVHLIIYDKNDMLSKIMQSLEVIYSSYFSKKYEKTGHLFQNRFLSKTVEERKYLMQVCRYIHQNPVKAGISKIDNYKWSSYQEYTSNKEKLVNTKLILSLFSTDKITAIEYFKKFHNDNDEEINDEFEYEIKTKFTDEETKNKIEKLLKIKDLKEINNFSIKIRDEKIKNLKVLKGIPYVQISRVLGLKKGIVERAMKN